MFKAEFPPERRPVQPRRSAAGAALSGVIMWTANVLLLAFALLMVKQNAALKSEAAKLHAQAAETDASRQERKDLEALRNELAELDSLRAQAREVFRLRNEVRELREELKERAAQPAAPQAGVVPQAAYDQLKAERDELERQLTGQQQLAQFQAITQAATQAQSCQSNLRLIDQAVAQWALDNAKPPGSHVDRNEVAEYLPNGAIPPCPAGGKYEFNLVGELPTCTAPDHQLEE